jgi:hypothetical protein
MGFEQTVDLVEAAGEFLDRRLHAAAAAGRLLEDQQLRFGEEAGSSGLTYGARRFDIAGGIP